ncbi:protein arginine kinase [Chlamydiota bacterium]
MDITEMINHTAKWMEGKGPHSDLVFSSRIRLARNLQDFHFLARETSENTHELWDKIVGAVQTTQSTKTFSVFNFQTLDDLDKQVLLERHLVSKEQVAKKGYRGVALSKDERVSLMINEEDHLRLQIILSGFQLEKAWQKVDKIDTDLGKKLPFAFSEEWGFLTACPTNVGTGMRASVMLHVPALVMVNQIEKVLNALNKLGLAIRGWYGEGSEAHGNLFQISNHTTLGLSETEIISRIVIIVKQLIGHEKNARKRLLKKDRTFIQDRIGRAYGILKNVRIISSQETLQHLSTLRMGIEMNLISGLDVKVINELFLLTQPAHIQKIVRKKLSVKARDEKRAEIITRIIGKESFVLL